MGKEAEKISENNINNKQVKKDKLKTTKNEKTNFSRKKFRFIIPLIVIICIIVCAWIVLNPEVVAGKIEAQLIIESGEVQVKSGEGSWKSAENGMSLHKSDSIKTGDNSSASIILFQTSVVRLDSNTEITLEELIREEKTSVTIQQESGRTWNAVNKISGIDNYEVQTPTTVASVRGTGFVVIVKENGSTYYGVSHGFLNISSISNGTIQDYINVSGNESVFVFVDLINESLEVVPFEIDEWVIENLLKDDQFMNDLKQELYSRIAEHILDIKTETGITDEEIDALLEGYILGYFDLPEDTPEWIRELFEFS